MVNKAKQFEEGMARTRGITFAKLGMMVEVQGDIGTIAGVNGSANLDVVFANQLKYGKHKHNCHPMYQIKYFDNNGKVVADYTGDKSV
ncbi:hypothetical protein ECML606-1_000055 [Escherichia phage ECML-606-1]|nr:hypothetical protein ECML606-1_000055 [Escherichia phage ECML-606-1]